MLLQEAKEAKAEAEDMQKDVARLKNEVEGLLQLSGAQGVQRSGCGAQDC